MVIKKKVEFDSREERLRYQICFEYIDLKAKTWPWPIKDKWYDSPPRGSENQWNYDKLGRPFRLGQAILWFTNGKNEGQIIQHVALITSHRVDTDVYYANPIKSVEYVNRKYENPLKTVGTYKNYIITDNLMEVARLRQEYGTFIISSLYNSIYLDDVFSVYAHLT